MWRYGRQSKVKHSTYAFLNVLADLVVELQTRLESAPFMGTPIFTMTLVMLVPSEVSVKTLRRNLEELAGTLNCDLDLDPA